MKSSEGGSDDEGGLGQPAVVTESEMDDGGASASASTGASASATASASASASASAPSSASASASATASASASPTATASASALPESGGPSLGAPVAVLLAGSVLGALYLVRRFALS